jgi:hypothetical protein
MQEGNYLKKKFPQLGSGEELNRKEYLMLTFSLCISLYSRLSYNALAIKIGEEILYSIYKHKYVKKSKSKKLQSVEFITFKEYKQTLNIDNTFFLKLGDFFMTLLQLFPHALFIREVTKDSFYTKEPFLLKINQEYLEEIKDNIIINPSTLPMICQPME